MSNQPRSSARTPSSRASSARQRRLPRAERELQMLEVAGKLFGEKGYDATSMDDIAAACGVTKPMLYAYYGSKEGLYKALVARAGTYVVTAITELTAEKDPRARMHKAADSMIAFVDKYRDSWQMVFTGGKRLQELPNIAVFREQVLNVTCATLAQFRPKEFPKDRARKLVVPYAHVFLGAAEAGAQWWLTTPGVTIPEVKKLASDVIESTIAMVKAQLSAAHSESTS
ncbi:MAG: TetR/AcrR family transcriptional regulator [Myxococcales bacterium]